MALIYENKVPVAYRKEFIAKVREICSKLGINPNWLMAIMYFESAGTFSASIKSPATNATGLIQFMPDTAKYLGTTVAALAKMTAVQQLDYVYKYYKNYTNQLNSYIDTYLVTFFPAAVGKGDGYLIQTSSLPASLIAKQNPSFDTNKDGKIYVWEVKKIMLSKLPSEWLKDGSFTLLYKSYKHYIWIGAAAITAGSAILFYYGRK